jgi:hypothetical protein
MKDGKMAQPARVGTRIGEAELRRLLVPGCDLNKEWAGKITLTVMTSLILSVAPCTAFCSNARHRRRNR